ncbi:MAG: hypothetical protein JO317_02680 [Verrucomicrobiae bacterium]|nr:hypothetical protein [Verrucomicrobiae bacterium]
MRPSASLISRLELKPKTRLALATFAALLLAACASTAPEPERPPGANVQITREKSAGEMMAAVPVVIKMGHIPIAQVGDGQTIFGTLQPGKHTLTANSPDPFSPSFRSEQTWTSAPLDFSIETGKFYKLEVLPNPNPAVAGWMLRLAQE